MDAATSPNAAARPRGADDFHPLEVIGYFRRWKPSPARDIAYTFLWNGLLTLFFFAIAAMFRPAAATWTGFAFHLLVVNTIGYTIHALFLVGEATGLCARARRAGSLAAVAYYTLTSTAGVVAGYFLVMRAMAMQLAPATLTSPRFLAMMGLSSLVISVMLASIFFARERQARAEAELERERLRAERVEREAARANLRALQAQIEPHFLFNTLANVAGLIDPDPAQARRMLERFIRFLRASLAATRRESTTLADEGELIAAYLDVLQIRMGARLAYAIDIEPSLAGFRLPPMLLQPLVENAIRHGLEPRVEGGEARLTARRAGGGVAIEVADTGAGFGAATSGGLGLTNLRERLDALYGDRARLEIRDNAPRGTVVTLIVPQ